MNPLTLEWIEKAKGDFITAGRELKVRKSPNYDAVCFHSQQVAEKYLKAFLQENNTPIPKIHSLLELLSICIGIDSACQFIYPILNLLEGYAVEFRYPGRFASKEDAKTAYNSTKSVRKWIRPKLGLPE